MGSLESVLASQMKERVVYRFSVPESIVSDVRSLGMVEMTADEEVQIELRCKNTPEKRAVEIAKASIVEINGKRVHNGAGEVDKAWNEMSPKVRSLVNRMWVKLHLANDEEVASFEKSMTASV